jgi:hypothetical protein
MMMMMTTMMKQVKSSHSLGKRTFPNTDKRRIAVPFLQVLGEQ